MNLNLFKIYFGVAFSLLAAASAWASAPLVQIAENESLLIDDFEDGDYNSNLGVWESFTGEGYNATFGRSIVDSEEKNSKVLRIDYEFQDEQENNGWEWMETRVLVANYTSLDFSNCTEIKFDYKAAYQNNSAYDNWLDLRFRVEGDDKNAYVETDYHSIPLDASDDWQTVTVHWNDFFQDGWGINLPVETVQKNMLAFGWFWHTEHAAQGTIELDNFRCINQPKYEVTFMADGKVFASDMYYSGTTPRDPLEECKYYDHCTRPTKEPSETMMYTFKEWDKNIEPVTAPVVYTALFDSTVIPRGVPLNMVGDELLIENFEDGDMNGELGGVWVFFDSENPSGAMTSEIVTDAGNKELKIGYQDIPYEWLGARLFLKGDSSAVDMSQCDAIQYRFKGNSHQLRIESSYENEWMHWHAEIPGSDSWATYVVRWKDLGRPSLADADSLKPVGVIKKKVVSLTWQYDAPYGNGVGIGFEIDNIKCLRTKFGAVTISAVDSTAIIDGLFADGEVLDIPEDIVVKNVELQRTFEVGKSSTVMLPFSIDVSKVNGADFYSLAEMEYADGEWKAGATKVTGTLEANTPYLAIPTSSAITFDLEENETVTLNTTGSKVTKLGDWEFRGAYGAIAMADSTHLLGRAYGFAGEDKDGYKIGEFVKLGKGATIPALRTYLVKTETESAQCPAGAMCAPHANSVASIEDLPDRITVEFLDEKENVMAVETLDAKTGKIRLDRYHLDSWYDLRGRRLNGKPSVKGTYYNNGNMVIIK
ncbi:MAG: hypothetical protein J5977_02340 [Fibrobacter sp.]|nr:hypothetical protein [Fibrobacter sp.]